MVLNSALHRIITFPSFTSGHPFNMNGPTVSNRSSELSNREVILRFSILKVIKTSGKYSVIFKMLPLKLCSSSFILQHSSDVGQDAGIQLWQRVGDKRVHGPPYVEIMLGILKVVRPKYRFHCLHKVQEKWRESEGDNWIQRHLKTRIKQNSFAILNFKNNHLSYQLPVPDTKLLKTIVKF